MSHLEIQVCVDVGAETAPVGRLFVRVVRGRESASFQYDERWLRHPARFALDPVYLPLGRGAFHTPRGMALFPGLSDSAPDRWGRLLMARQARLAGERRTLFEADYLLRVHDLSRQGAVRFREPGSDVFLAQSSAPVPPLVCLGELLAAADRVQRDPGDDDALRLLLAPGSSLGGARPKASVMDSDGQLAIAKFTSERDAWPVILWEHVANRLAAAAGITVPATRVVHVGDRPVLIARRFDRSAALRRPFLSAMAMLGAAEREEEHSYLEIVDALRQLGDRVEEDLEELWRRMVFNVLITNTDDHLRNHGFLRTGMGWRLAPAYDLNPVPEDVRPRVHALALDEANPRSSLRTVLSVADYFGLSRRRAVEIVRQVTRGTARWRALARASGLSAAEVDRMKSAFEHEDRRFARGLR